MLFVKTDKVCCVFYGGLRIGDGFRDCEPSRGVHEPGRAGPGGVVKFRPVQTSSL